MKNNLKRYIVPQIELNILNNATILTSGKEDEALWNTEWLNT